MPRPEKLPNWQNLATSGHSFETNLIDFIEPGLVRQNLQLMRSSGSGGRGAEVSRKSHQFVARVRGPENNKEKMIEL